MELLQDELSHSSPDRRRTFDAVPAQRDHTEMSPFCATLFLYGQIGRGYAEAKGRHNFRDFIDAVGLLPLTEDEMIVRYQKRAHNSLDECRGGPPVR